MSSAIRIWGVEKETLTEISRQAVDLESRLEEWMDSNISVLSDDLLIIGRQLDTDGGGILDLLCLDRAGDVVVVELKRGKTPREVVAQVLDYAAWAADLSYDDLTRIGDDYLDASGGLSNAFRARFDAELPDVLNADHQLLVVASEVDSRSERIIRYLSEAHGVSINAITFNYFQTSEGQEFLARTHLIEPEAVEDRTVRRSGSKRRRTPTIEEHREVAAQHGVGELFDCLIDGLSRWRKPEPLKTMVTFYLRDEEGWMATLNIVASESSPDKGLRFNVYKHRLGRAFGLSPSEVQSLLPTEIEAWAYSSSGVSEPDNDLTGYTGAFLSETEVAFFLEGLQAAPRQPNA